MSYSGALIYKVKRHLNSITWIVCGFTWESMKTLALFSLSKVTRIVS